jgi:putative phosphoesterase
VKIAVIADTHLPRGARRLPDECLRRLAKAELILHAGDFVTVEVLRELGQLAPVVGVRGNVDELRLAPLLPERRVVEVEGVRIGMVHDAGAERGDTGGWLRCSPAAMRPCTATATCLRSLARAIS